MNVLFRADSSLRIGTGHVMRCLAFADHLQREGTQIRFVCRNLAGNINRVVTDRGFPLTELPPRGVLAGDDVPSPEWQDPEWRVDADDVLAAVAGAERPLDWIIVDNYALAAPWEERMRAVARHVMAIDDLANRPHDCDVLLDQNLGFEMNTRYDGLAPANCRRLLGPRYALLRPEFSVARRTSRRRDGSVRRILVFLGGTDPGNETRKALLAISGLARNDIAIDVVAGAANPNFEGLRALCSRLPRARLHHGTASMAQLMGDADLAIGAPGVTTWERCCLGLPTVLIALAMNQESAALALAAGRYAIYLGKSESVTADSIRAALQGLIADPSGVLSLSSACASLVDGRGAERAVRAVDAGPISLRPAQEEDSARIREWRNAEETRRYSHRPEVIAQAEHQQWFRRVLADPGRILLIAERRDRPVGVLRYDCEASRCTVSIYLVPGHHGRGYGPRILCAGHEWLNVHRPEIESIRAEVLPGNLASAEAFLQAGYRRDGDGYVRDLT